jgi:hypothetical protein
MDKVKALAYKYDPGCHAGTNLTLRRIANHQSLSPREFQTLLSQDFHLKLTINEIRNQLLPLFGTNISLHASSIGSLPQRNLLLWRRLEYKETGEICCDDFISFFLRTHHQHVLQKRQSLAKRFPIVYPDANEPLA